MQISFLNLTNEWIALEDLVTLDENEMYQIQNRGYDDLLLFESSSIESDSIEGIIVRPYHKAKYKKGDNKLFMRAYNKTCSINISTI